MKFDPPLKAAKFLRRYKRFFADMQLPDGSIETAHCPNTGSMLNCLVEDSPCYYSTSDNPKRKLKTTLEYVTCASGKLACINTHRANQIVKQSLFAGSIEELCDYSEIASEVKYGEENSRIDFKLSGDNLADCYVEVKSVTLAETKVVSESEGLIGYFPDAVTTRGQKHLRELIAMVNEGHRAVLFFSVQHQGVQAVRVAEHIDAKYAELLTEAIAAGVEVLAYQALISPEELKVEKRIPFQH
jgi:sugar fermentation stimulation protein A